MSSSFLSRIEHAISALQQGKIVLLIDSLDRENEGDFVFPAEKITPKIINFMIKNGSGIICIALLKERLEKLQLPLMLSPEENTTKNKTAFTIPVDAKINTTTGVSATDRAITIQALMNPETKPEDFARPGHVYPLQAESQGVLVRPGHTEGAMDIVKLAGFQPGAVICEAVDQDGNTIKGKNLIHFAEKLGIPHLFIEDLLQYYNSAISA